MLFKHFKIEKLPVLIKMDLKHFKVIIIIEVGEQTMFENLPPIN